MNSFIFPLSSSKLICFTQSQQNGGHVKQSKFQNSVSSEFSSRRLKEAPNFAILLHQRLIDWFALIFHKKRKEGKRCHEWAVLSGDEEGVGDHGDDLLDDVVDKWGHDEKVFFDDDFERAIAPPQPDTVGHSWAR